MRRRLARLIFLIAGAIVTPSAQQRDVQICTTSVAIR